MIKLIDNHCIMFVDNDNQRLLIDKETLVKALSEVTPVYRYFGNDLEHPKIVKENLEEMIKELWELARQRKAMG